MNKHTSKIAALLFLMCFIMAALLAEAAVHEHDHDCACVSCVLCTHIMKNLFKQPGNTLYALVRLFALIAVGCPLLLLIKIQTPVDLKIRLNN
jgi:hypothetical protein